jgi:thymidylate synthase ThyX
LITWGGILIEEEFLIKTNTFGKTLEEKEFSEEEKIVLTHFFTNIDKNIYAATDNMPSSLWALLEGGYSRSKLSMRERFLRIFSEMQEEYEEGKLSKEELITISNFAEQIKSGGQLNMSSLLSKAEKFMRKWAVQYGHSSLKDSDVVRFAIENVSQFIVNPIEETKLGAFQEKSTRYVEFTREHLVVPTDLKDFEQDIRSWNNLLISSYEESMPIVKEFIANKLNKDEFKTEAAFNRTVNAKAFDIVRYFIPNTMLTSLGVVLPTREAERHISRLLSDARKEMRSVGRALLEEGKKISPGLLSHVAVNEYYVKRRTAMDQLQSKIELTKAKYEIGRKDSSVKLINITTDMEARIAAGILFEHNNNANGYLHYLNLCLKDKNLIKITLKNYLESRSGFDEFPLATEIGSMMFDITMDFGAYRDLMRHRRNLFLCSSITAELGYEYPEFVENNEELIKVKEKFDYCAEITKELHLKIKNKFPHLAGYVVMFANKQQMLWQMDPRQLAYIAELRTTPAGHYSYRHICQKMFKIVQEHMPTLCDYINVDLSSGEEGRKKQEERTVEKLKNIGANLEKVD